MRKKLISALLTAIMAFAVALPMVRNTQASPQTTLEIFPQTTIVEWGEIFIVNVNIVDVSGLAGYESKLEYYPSILQVLDIVGISPFGDTYFLIDEMFAGVPTHSADVVQDGVLDIYDWIFILGHWYDTSGPVPIIGPCGYDARADIWPTGGDGQVDVFDAAKFNSALNIVDMQGVVFSWWHSPWLIEFTGSATLARIILKAIDFGESPLNLYDTKLSPICGEQPINHVAIDGTVIVVVPPGREEEAMQSLITSVESLDLDGGTENSLTVKLEAAIHLFNSNNLNGAVQKVGDFINKVEAMRSKRLTDEQADYLVDKALAIINAIG